MKSYPSSARFLLLILFLGLAVFISSSVDTVDASSHYSYEHAEKMRISGKIEWRDYGADAFQEAVEQNKPVFLLLTAPSWCYWCHVYTSDDFIYHPLIYPIINEKMVPIYVDADQRQDLTRKYLEGGWPSTTVLTPGNQRLFGYSGPRTVGNMVVTMEEAVQYVKSSKFFSDLSYNYEISGTTIPTTTQLSNLIRDHTLNILSSYDPVKGGFGTDKKFPQGRSLDFAIESYDSSQDIEFLILARNTLENQYTDPDQLTEQYHLFDPIEGGFHRYSMEPDWSSPHYEKMLNLNARLLKAYAHLSNADPDNSLALLVAEKTDEYIRTNWYDEKLGGFYANTDVKGGKAYYQQNPRPPERPRIEKTKYSDWNSEAVLTYLYLWKITDNIEYRDIAQKSLNFLSEYLVHDQGAFHYIKENGERGVRGGLLDNCYLLLSFATASEGTQQDNYLSTAKRIADYSLSALYDWNNGGFFERNSPDENQYAYGEHIDLSKPVEENGIMTYAMLKLYNQTGDVRYLNAAVTTMGNILSHVGELDDGHYAVKSAQLMLEFDILSDYEAHKKEINKLERKEINNYWLDGLKTNDRQFTEGIFSSSIDSADTIDGPLITLMLISFLAGILSLLSPCTLPILPAYVSYTFAAARKNTLIMSIMFFLGLSVMFTLLGVGASFIGSFLDDNILIFTQVTGVSLAIFGIAILLGKGFAGPTIQRKNPVTYAGTFFFGTIVGLAFTPCVGPILVGILLLASTSGSLSNGGLLLFTYSAGLSAPLLIISASVQRLPHNGILWRSIRGKELRVSIGGQSLQVHSSALIAGFLFISLGYLIFSGNLTALNQYATSSGLQKWIFSIEEFLLNMLQ